MAGLQGGVRQVSETDRALWCLDASTTVCYPPICSMTPQTPLLLAPPRSPTPMPSHCASGACGRLPPTSRCGAWGGGSGCSAAAWSTCLPATGGNLQPGPSMAGASSYMCLLQTAGSWSCACWPCRAADSRSVLCKTFCCGRLCSFRLDREASLGLAKSPACAALVPVVPVC